MSVLADIEKAYALDGAAGVPAELRRRFLVGYGSTLRNVGRVDEAVTLLTEAMAEDPHYPAYGAFLGLALLSAGHPRAAVATLLDVIIEQAKPALDGFHRALGEYQQLLLHAEVPEAKLATELNDG
jgi:predicted Zn-dependent protease